MADTHGTVVSLHERDCTLQRRHQKIVEETPSPAVTPEIRTRLGAMAIAAARAVGYVGAGTIECLMDTRGDVYFLEMNTRIQVEHTITEMATGIDLVREQILVAQGAPLSFAQDDVGAARPRHRVPRERRGPDHRSCPRRAASRGTASRPGPGVRVDSALEEGGEVVALYDPMVAKLVVWDRTRDLARARMRRALDEMVVEGVRTLIPLHRLIMEAPEFARGETCAGLVEDVWPRQLAAVGGAARGTAADATRSRSYVAEVDGRRFEVRVHAPDDPVLVEARRRREARRSGGGRCGRGGHRHEPDAGQRAARSRWPRATPWRPAR